MIAVLVHRNLSTVIENAVLGALALLVGVSVQASPILLDLHSGPHGGSVTDGTAWFQDNHEKHANASTSTFLKLGSTNSLIQGHNGSDADSEFPEVKTRTDILLSEVPLFLGFRVFLFDGNQTQKSGVYDHLDMTMLKIYTAASSQTTLASIQTNGTLAYDLDKEKDHTVRIEGRQGSGGADMHLFVPDSLFTQKGGSDSSTYVYLYSKFEGNNDGDEHWNLDSGEFSYTNPVPAPGTWPLLAAGLYLVGRFRRRMATPTTQAHLRQRFRAASV